MKSASSRKLLAHVTLIKLTLWSGKTLRSPGVILTNAVRESAARTVADARLACRYRAGLSLVRRSGQLGARPAVASFFGATTSWGVPALKGGAAFARVL